MEARRGSGIEHSEIIGITIDTEETSLSPLIVSKEELRRESFSFLEENRRSESEALLDRIQGEARASEAIKSGRSRHVNSCRSHGLENRSGSLSVIIKAQEGHGSESIREGAPPTVNRSGEEGGESGRFGRGELEADRVGIMP